MSVKVLACKCADCTHWEIVQMEDGTIHLHCKTCETTDELDAFTLHEKPGNNVKWVERDEE
jgi:hypothetical protein